MDKERSSAKQTCRHVVRWDMTEQSWLIFTQTCYMKKNGICWPECSLFSLTRLFPSWIRASNSCMVFLSNSRPWFSSNWCHFPHYLWCGVFVSLDFCVCCYACIWELSTPFKKLVYPKLIVWTDLTLIWSVTMWGDHIRFLYSVLNGEWTALLVTSHPVCNPITHKLHNTLFQYLS